uniref:G-protein coupled receptors family 3 profile domain-containing protein n=1 Tax=Sus scrofa TaxID=9823 RepID=F1SA32_PIG
MASKNSSLIHGLFWLLLHFGWIWVALFFSDDREGEHFLWDLKAEMLQKGICVAFTEKILTTKRTYGSTDIHFLTRNRVWILVAKWDVVLNEVDSILHSSHGILSFSLQKRKIPGFQHFLKTVNPSQYPENFYLCIIWFKIFTHSLAGSLRGKVNDCLPNSSLEFMPMNIDVMTMSDSNYFIYNAVYAVVQTLHEMLLHLLFFGCKENQFDVLQPFLDKIQFRNSAGEHISLDEKRYHVVKYDIMNIVSFPGGLGFLVKGGESGSSGLYDQGLVINKEMIEWPTGFKETPQSVCSQSCSSGFRKIPQEEINMCNAQQKEIFLFTITFKCGKNEMFESFSTDAEQCRNHCLPKVLTFLAFEDSMGMSLTCMVLCFFVITAVILLIFANNWALSYVLLISLLLGFLCPLLFIGRPSTATCILRQITFGALFTVAVATVLAKTLTVILAFKAMRPGRIMRRLLVTGASNYVIPICFLIQVVICGVWLGTSPPFLEIHTHSEPKNLILMCNKGTITAFYCILGYLGFLALRSFSLAFLARSLPDTFNESKFLTFSMLVFYSVWVTFLPIHHSNKGKAMVAMEIFSILGPNAGLLGCIFVPKCYIILLRPDKNSLKGLRNQIGSTRNRHSGFIS